jgi:hypothetical protein
MAARRRLKAVKIPLLSPLSDIQFALGQIQAAMWLLDQVYTGELSFLDQGWSNPGSWNSFVSISPDEIRDHLRGMAERAVADALKLADARLSAAATQAPRAEGLAGGGA